MVIERFFSSFVFPEAFIFFIIVLNICFAFPIFMTFYSEVIVGIHGKCAVAVVGFKQSLRERDAGRNSVHKHFFYGDVFVFFYILDARNFVFGRLSKQNGKWKMENE